MSEQKRFHSGFTRVRVTDQGGQKIKKLQEEFDVFWRKMNKYADKGTEKFYALKAMQESCMWLTRACALSNESIPDFIIDDPLCPTDAPKKPTPMEIVFGKLPELKAGDTITNNGINIVVKKKRI